MSIIATLITDRAEADRAELEALLSRPLAEWTAEELDWFNQAKSKGSYDYTDLNRVTSAMEYLNTLLTGYGYITGYQPVSVVPGRTVWREDDEYTPAQLQQYLADVVALRAVLELLPTTPEVPADMDGLTVQEANDIEKILLDIDALLSIMATTFIPCGGALCGEDNL